MTFNWIHFGNNDCIVDFLTVIYQQMTRPSDPDKCTDLWQNSNIFCFGGGGGPKTTKVNFSEVNEMVYLTKDTQNRQSFFYQTFG